MNGIMKRASAVLSTSDHGGQDCNFHSIIQRGEVKIRQTEITERATEKHYPRPSVTLSATKYSKSIQPPLIRTYTLTN